MFADDPALFSIIRDTSTSTINLNNVLKKIRNWAI